MNRDHLKSTLLTLLVPVVLLVIAMIIVITKVERPAALIQTGIEWMEVGVLALAMTAIIITGGIDLSVASIVGLCVVTTGVLFDEYSWSYPAAATVAVAVGILAGSLNGLAIVGGLSPLIVTLATMALYSGLALSIAPEAGIQMPIALEDSIYFGRWPLQYFIFLTALLFAYILLHHTRNGRTCFYLGENPVAARYVALPVNRTLLSVYLLSGLLAGVVAVMYVMSRTTAIAIAHQGAELKVIACVVVGGTLITGGHGSIGRTFLGLCVMASLDICLDLMSNDYVWMDARVKMIVMGGLVIAIAVWNQWLARRLN
ncbi:MAG: ABC transporter permease [Planctomycetaceae bacterium]|nr:ABC transporter permease [Planctomycetaceae bacterium]|tara:strand:+ start:2953 stop:3897 length:945 start_codon:yes stop_codon:yes gene_type:complete